MQTVAGAGETDGRKAFLSAERLSWSTRGRQVISVISLHVDAGEIVGLLGPNGAGKTSILKVLAGAIKPSAGTILMEGKDITMFSARKRASIGIQSCLPVKTVFKKWTALEQLAKGMGSGSKVFLLDEPLDQTDQTPLPSAGVLALIQEAREHGRGVLVTAHNVRNALSIVDRAYIIAEGRILIEGTKEQLLGQA